ncbi:MAG: thermonuclease family protein [Candidatus Gastranaerophilales bacterium]|nr:thermonuclease family protein [Candidatus Gastranaerophilales bacterium]
MQVYAAERVAVKLSRVFDGDTIEVTNEKSEKEIIRFLGIDTYETSPSNRAYRQAYENNLKIEQVVAEGVKSKLILVKLFKDNSTKQLYLERHGKDKYGRTLGVMYLGKINIEKYMLENGNA